MIELDPNDPNVIDLTGQPIFPMVLTIRKENALEMQTFLRIKHRGKWYAKEFYRSAYVPKDTNDYSAAVSSLTRDIYMAILHGGQISVTKKDSKGILIDKLDRNQQDEKLRMLPLDHVNGQN